MVLIAEVGGHWVERFSGCVLQGEDRLLEEGCADFNCSYEERCHNVHGAGRMADTESSLLPKEISKHSQWQYNSVKQQNPNPKPALHQAVIYTIPTILAHRKQGQEG